MRVKIAVLAPMPSASDRIATMENRGLRKSPRTANRMSLIARIIRRLDDAAVRRVGARVRGLCQLNHEIRRKSPLVALHLLVQARGIDRVSRDPFNLSRYNGQVRLKPDTTYESRIES